MMEGYVPRVKNPLADEGITLRHTLCSICNAATHCAIDAYTKDGKVIKVEGTREHPFSRGKLCAKGAASREYIYNADRVQTPLLRRGPRGSGRFEAISWDQALDLVAERLGRVKDEAGPESVVFYVGYPKWMRPFVQRLGQNFGSPNFCTESSTCFTAMYLAFKLNYGNWAVPHLPATNCLLMWSCNPFYSNMPKSLDLMDKIRQGLEVIEVGPLTTPLTRHASLHLRIRPGTSGALALAMGQVIIAEGLYDRDFVANWTHGFEEYRQYVQEFTPQRAQEITGVPAELISEAARRYARGKPSAMWTSAATTVQHTNGLQNTRAMTALVGLTGNFDVPGGNMAVTPRFLGAAGGLETREEEFSLPVPYDQMPPLLGNQRFPVFYYGKPQGQSMELARQIDTGRPYPLRALVAFGLNHRMWPGNDYLKEQLAKLDFMVVADPFLTDSAKLADLVLPVCTSFEREELKLYPGNYLFMSQKVIEPLGQSRSDLEVITDLARRLTPEDQLLCQGPEACLDWIFQPSGVTMDEVRKHPVGFVPPNAPPPAFRKYETQGFATPSGKMEFVSMRLEQHGYDGLPTYAEPKLSPISTPEVAREFPLVLTTGARLPMYVHSRTFRVPGLRRLRPDPMVDINPADAGERSIAQGDPVELATPRSAVQVKANLTQVVPPGVVSIYHGYPEVEVNNLVDPDYLDPVTGFPGFKSLLAQVTKI